MQMASDSVQKESIKSPITANDDVNLSPQTANPFSETRVVNSGIHDSANRTNKTMKHEVITEEQLEESAQNTKRQSLEQAPNTILHLKTLASASAPNLNQSASTTQVKSVNLVSCK